MYSFYFKLFYLIKKVTKKSRPKNATDPANKETIELYVCLGLKQMPTLLALTKICFRTDRRELMNTIENN
jgi:hypothetical protein